MLRVTVLSASLAVGLMTAGARAETNIMFILDGSNSMWGQIEGEAKIDTARSVLNDALSGLPSNVVPGLMIYGDRRKDDCSDIQLVAPLGSASIAALKNAVSTVSPRGKTPIAGALKAAGDAFAGREEENNNILLISDGIESCDGDPCAVAGELVQRGTNVRVHVVGFDVDDKARAQLQCIAEKGNGKYFDAKNAGDFQAAIQQAQAIAMAEAAEPEPPPAEPALTLYYEDQFDGEELSADWEVVNPNLDAYIVENGELLAINSTPAGLDQDNIQNIFKLAKNLPKDNWVMTAKIRVDFQSGVERVFFGLYKDKETYLVSELSTITGSCATGGSYSFHLNLSPVKATRGQITRSDHEVWKIPRCDGGTLSALMAKAQPMLLRIEKKGRSYTSSIKLEGTEEPEWISLPALTSLRSPGQPALGVYQESAGTGETAINVDWLKIETLE